VQKDPELPDLPSAIDFVRNGRDRRVMELNCTQKTAARPIVAPPAVPTERVEALRAAFAALSADREFLDDAERSKLEIAPVSAEAVDKVVALVASAPADVAQRYAEVLGGVCKAH